MERTFHFLFLFCVQDVSDCKSMSNDESIMTNYDSSANNSLMTEDEDEKVEPQKGTNMPKKSK